MESLIFSALGAAAVFLGGWIKEAWTRRTTARERAADRLLAQGDSHSAQLRDAYAGLIPAYQNLLDLGLALLNELEFVSETIRDARTAARDDGQSDLEAERTAHGFAASATDRARALAEQMQALMKEARAAAVRALLVEADPGFDRALREVMIAPLLVPGTDSGPKDRIRFRLEIADADEKIATLLDMLGARFAPSHPAEESPVKGPRRPRYPELPDRGNLKLPPG